MVPEKITRDDVLMRMLKAHQDCHRTGSNLDGFDLKC